MLIFRGAYLIFSIVFLDRKINSQTQKLTFIDEPYNNIENNKSLFGLGTKERYICFIIEFEFVFTFSLILFLLSNKLKLNLFRSYYYL